MTSVHIQWNFFPLQMRAENLPVPEPSTNTSDGTDHPPQPAQSSWFTGAAFLKLLRPPFAVFGKPRHQEIHSGKILDEDRLSTLAPLSPDFLITPLVLYTACLLYVPMHILTSVILFFPHILFPME